MDNLTFLSTRPPVHVTSDRKKIPLLTDGAIPQLHAQRPLPRDDRPSPDVRNAC